MSSTEQGQHIRNSKEDNRKNRKLLMIPAVILTGMIVLSDPPLAADARETAYMQENVFGSVYESAAEDTPETAYESAVEGTPGMAYGSAAEGNSESASENASESTSGPDAVSVRGQLTDLPEPSLFNYISFAPGKGRRIEPVRSARGFRARAYSLLIGYLLGMFLTAEAVTRKLTGKPCSELGETGNPGMANVMAHLGMKPGFTVLAGDIGKTVAATLLSWILEGSLIGRLSILYAALGVTLGHNYPAWNRFRGGKGVATTCAGIAAFSFGWGIGADLVGALTVLISHYLCVGAIVIPLAFLIPVFALYGAEAGTVAAVLAVLMAIRHMPAVLGIRSGDTPAIDLIEKIRRQTEKKHREKQRMRQNGEKEDAGAPQREDSGTEPEPVIDERFLREVRRQRGAAAVAQMDMETEIIREHILFYGRVQGVGFRYQAMYGARQYGLTGWVENLEDGTVEMEVQGTAAGIGRLLTQLQSGRWIRIDTMEAKDEPVQPDERSFRVRGY